MCIIGGRGRACVLMTWKMRERVNHFEVLRYDGVFPACRLHSEESDFAPRVACEGTPILITCPLTHHPDHYHHRKRSHLEERSLLARSFCQQSLS